MKTIITIGREFGSGGREAARRLAESLAIPFYDKELIRLTAKQSGLAEDFLQQLEEHWNGSFLYNLYFSQQELSLSDQAFIAESQVIRQVADQGPCVIVGRCANYILKSRPNCVHAFLYGPVEIRAARAQQERQIAGEGIQRLVQKKDKARAAYYNHFTGQRWGDPHDYDLSINCALGDDGVLRLLQELIACKEAGQSS